VSKKRNRKKQYVKDQAVSTPQFQPVMSHMNDSLVNVMTKAAIRHRDVTNPANNYFEAIPMLDYAQLENIYISSWIGKKIVDLPIEFMFKEGLEVNIDGEDSLEKECLEYYKENKIEDLYKEMVKYKKMYGGAIMFPKDKFQDPMKPYSFESFKGRDIEFIVKDLTYLAVTPYIDIISRKYFEPKTFVMAGLSMLAENCIQARGIQVPKRRIPQFRYMGMSVYQNIFEAMISDQYISKGIVNMVYRGNMKYYSLDGLHDTVKQGGQELVFERIGLIEDGASIMSAGILDAKDKVEFVTQSFANLDQIDYRSLTRLSASTGIPSILLQERAPEKTGLGGDNSEEVEIMNNYTVKEQKDNTPIGNEIFQTIAYILSGKKKKVEVNFKKAHTTSPKTQGETDKIILENVLAQQQLGISEDVITDYMVRMGMLTTEQAVKEKANIAEMKEYSRALEVDYEESTVQPVSNSKAK
jgi:phage-related protein (TIGR01555 family)